MLDGSFFDEIGIKLAMVSFPKWTSAQKGAYLGKCVDILADYPDAAVNEAFVGFMNEITALLEIDQEEILSEEDEQMDEQDEYASSRNC